MVYDAVLFLAKRSFANNFVTNIPFQVPLSNHRQLMMNCNTGRIIKKSNSSRALLFARPFPYFFLTIIFFFQIQKKKLSTFSQSDKVDAWSLQSLAVFGTKI